MIKFAMLASTIASNLFFASEALSNQSTQETHTEIVYERNYFEKFTPLTARDMVVQIPGFKLDLGNDQRGFGTTAGNILINGSRPPSKSVGIATTLGSISAQSVARIILLKGITGNGETAGQNIIINIITQTKETSGFWETKLSRDANGQLSGKGNFSYSNYFDGWALTGRLSTSVNRHPFSANGTRQFFDENNLLTKLETETRPLKSEAYSIAINAEKKFTSGSLSLSSRFNEQPRKIDTTRIGFNGYDKTETSLYETNIQSDRSLKSGEFGLNWHSNFNANWSWKLLSFFSSQDTENFQSLINSVNQETPTSQFYLSNNTANEAAIRSFLTYKKATDTIDLGLEYAYNEHKNELASGNSNNNAQNTNGIPTSDITVAENRAELFATYYKNITKNLTFDAGLALELSRIQVSGDASSSKSFSYIKPSATITYSTNNNLQFILNAKHSVGQLSFSDFAASASITDDRVVVGNPNLGPDQTKSLSLTMDYHSENKIAWNISLFHDWKTAILEELILESGYAGIANVGKARLWGAEINGTLPLSCMLVGAKLELQGRFIDSKFFDPVINQHRHISGTDTPNITLKFRQDLSKSKASWGISYTAPFDGYYYFINEISYNKDTTYWAAFIEKNFQNNFKLRIDYTAIGGITYKRKRQFFETDRSGNYLGSQVIDSNVNSKIAIKLSKQF